MKTLQEQRTDSVLKMQERIIELEKENAELKDLVNQYKASKCSGISLVNRNMIMSEQLTKAKKLLNEFMRISKASDEDFEHDYSELIAEAEQFLKDSEEK